MWSVRFITGLNTFGALHSTGRVCADEEHTFWNLPVFKPKQFYELASKWKPPTGSS